MVASCTFQKVATMQTIDDYHMITILYLVNGCIMYIPKSGYNANN